MNTEGREKKLRKYGVIFALWLAAILLDMRFSFGFIGFFDFILLLSLVAIVLAFAGIIHYLTKKKINVLRIGIILLLFCLTEFVAVGLIISWQRNITIKEGNKIVRALDDYYTVKKKYPDSLGELVPGYLEKVPSTKMGWLGTDFFYDSSEVKVKYTLGFDYHVFIICSYSPLQKGWVCDD